MRSYKVNKITHQVYESREEFPHGLVLDNWREGQIGDWVLADDGCIIQVLRKGQMLRAKGKKKIREYIGTCTGTFPTGPNVRMDTSKRANIYSFSGEKAPNEVLLDRTRLTGREKMFVVHLHSGLSPTEAYLKAFPTNNARYATEKAARLQKTERIYTAMKEELKPICEELGLDPTYVLKGIKSTAETSEKEDVRLRALFKLSDILDLEDKSKTNVTQLTATSFQGFTPEMLEQADKVAIGEKKDE
jgi:hypothetical protein